MSLKHDPSAIRYASTQEAYGTTWTLDKVEDDGAQVWKNAKGQIALVQKAVEQVRQQLPPRPVWKLIDIGQGNESFGKVERKPIKNDRVATITNKTILPSITVREFNCSEFDAKLTKALTAKAAIGAAIQAKTGPFPAIISNASISNLVNAAGYSSEDLSMPRPDPPYGAEYGNAATGRTSSVKPNESNPPKVITNIAVADNGQVIDGFYYDRCLTNEEIVTIWNSGYEAVPGGKKIFEQSVPFAPTPGSYVGERKINPCGVTCEWNGTRWVEVNKASDRKVSADASREWEYDGAEWKRVR